MNLLLVAERRGEYRWPAGSREYDFLRRLGQEEVRLGEIGGPRGIARILSSDAREVVLGEIRWEPAARMRRPAPLELWVGLPRPSEARRVLWHAGSFGVQAIGFLRLERTPAGYADSRLLEEAPAFLREGAEQGFHTNVPEYLGIGSLEDWCARDHPAGRIGLDPYRGDRLLGEERGDGCAGALVYGGERGWARGELDRLTAAGIQWRHLGPSILRSEAALVTGLTLALRAGGHLADARSARLEE